MIDSHVYYSVDQKGKVKEYRFKYAFRNMPYLVCDKYGNFFVLPHCRNKRSVNFKMLNSSGGYVYYQGNKIKTSTLRKRVILKDDKFTEINY